MTGFLRRIGGVVVAPLATMRVLARGGGAKAVADVGWLIALRLVAGELPSLVSAGARTVKLGLGAGLQALLLTVGQIAPDVLGILVAGLLLSLFAGRKRDDAGREPERATPYDLAAYAWVPYLAGRLVFVLGAIASGHVPSSAAQRIADVGALAWALVAWVAALVALRERSDGEARPATVPRAAAAMGILVVGMLSALGALRGVAVARGWEELTTVAVPTGSNAPAVELSMADGTRARIPDPDGRAVVLAFWATWCAPCREELPRLERVVARLGEAQRWLRVVAVNIEEPEMRPEAMRLHRTLAPSLELAVDGNGAAARYRVVTIPHTVVVGPDGIVRATLDGLHDERAIAEALRTAIDAAAAPSTR
jgi:thiol-disulfide isomerase/thioredoxin